MTRSSRTRARRRASTRRARPRSPSFSTATGRPKPLAASGRAARRPCSGMLTEPSDLPVLPVDHGRDPEADRGHALVGERLDRRRRSPRAAPPASSVGVGTSCARAASRRRRSPRRDLRAAEIDTDDSLGAHGTAATIPPRMAGRREALPGLQGRPRHEGRCRPRRRAGAGGRARAEPPDAAGHALRWGRRIGIAVARPGRPARRLVRRQLPRLPQRRSSDANARLAEDGEGEPRAAGRRADLEAVADPRCSAPTAASTAGARTRAAPTRSCSSAPTRSGTGWRTSRSRAISASTSPATGPNKINAAFQLGGPALTLKTVTALTGLQPNHVVARRLRRLQGA